MKLLLLSMVMISTVLGSTDYVGVKVSPGTLEAENGNTVSFTLRLKASEGIHLNAEPAIIVKSMTNGAELSIAEIHKAGEYLDLAKPIRVSCRVDGLTPGRHRVDFFLSYTYCSDNEGWCRMGKDSSSIEIHVKK
jgi:hypothetical protein